MKKIFSRIDRLIHKIPMKKIFLIIVNILHVSISRVWEAVVFMIAWNWFLMGWHIMPRIDILLAFIIILFVRGIIIPKSSPKEKPLDAYTTPLIALILFTIARLICFHSL